MLRFFSNFLPFISFLIQVSDQPGTPGQDWVIMTLRKSSQEYETDEEFFFVSLEGHGRDPSLFSLWQLFNATPLPSLQNNDKRPLKRTIEWNHHTFPLPHNPCNASKEELKQSGKGYPFTGFSPLFLVIFPLLDNYWRPALSCRIQISLYGFVLHQSMLMKGPSRWCETIGNCCLTGKNRAGWKIFPDISPTSRASYHAGINLQIKPGTPGYNLSNNHIISPHYADWALMSLEIYYENTTITC
jgi:hypothetical protein